MLVAEIDGPPEYGLPIVPIMVLTYHAKSLPNVLHMHFCLTFQVFVQLYQGYKNYDTQDNDSKTL